MLDKEAFYSYYIDLPADPEEAFFVYSAKKLAEMEADRHDESGWYYERRYVDAMLAFDEVYGLDLLSKFQHSPLDDVGFSDFFYEFSRAVAKLCLKFQLEHSRRVNAAQTAIVRLDAESRKAIRLLIDALRVELDKLSLSERKRSSLYGKLNAFAHEVDQNLSRTESIFSLAVEVARGAEELGGSMKGVADRVDRIIDILERAQKWAESLPPWNKRKELPAPPKQIEQSKSSKDDDDIPF